MTEGKHQPTASWLSSFSHQGQDFRYAGIALDANSLTRARETLWIQVFRLVCSHRSKRGDW